MAHSGGKACFVAGALPGEEVTAVFRQRRRQYDRADVLTVVKPSPDRLLPLCPHTRLCGGCSLQVLRYEAQLAEKARQVRDCLERIGGFMVDEPAPPLPAPVLTGYRNKMEFTFAPRAWVADGPPTAPLPSPALGLHVPGRFDAVFDLESCVLPPAASVRVLAAVRDFARGRGLASWTSREDAGCLRHLIVRQGMNTGDLLAGLVVRRLDPRLEGLGTFLMEKVPELTGAVLVLNEKPAAVARGDREILLSGRPGLTERLLHLRFDLQLLSFFQTNTWGAEVLLSAVRRLAASRPGGTVLDLYCGAGTLGLGVAEFFDSVTGVESVESAVRDARANAAGNGIANASFLHAPVEDWIENVPAPSPWPGILVDPPRAGLHPRALRGLVRLSPAWILYVSCNPSTLARDAAGLREAGYRPKSLQIVDMFPHTAHIESVLLLER